MCFLLLSHRCESAVKTLLFSSATLPTSTLGAWARESRVFRKKPWTRSLVIHGPAIFGNCRTLWSDRCCYPRVPRCECLWAKSLLGQTPARLAVATRWSKPSESRSCAHSGKVIGSSEVLWEPQLVSASTGPLPPP